jgi:hypothetical protein
LLPFEHRADGSEPLKEADLQWHAIANEVGAIHELPLRACRVAALLAMTVLLSLSL